MLYWLCVWVGVLILVCGLGNILFMGYLMVEVMYGKLGLVLVVVVD